MILFDRLGFMVISDIRSRGDVWINMFRMYMLLVDPYVCWGVMCDHAYETLLGFRFSFNGILASDRGMFLNIIPVDLL